MEVLKRRVNPKNYFFLAGGMSILLITNWQRLSIPYPFLWVGFMVSLCIIFWFRYGNKPAAWVKNDCLYIFNGLFSPFTLSKLEVDKLIYELASDSEHMIIVKLKNGSSQSILIHDRKEHIEGRRLANFINQHFIAIEDDTSNKANHSDVKNAASLCYYHQCLRTGIKE